MSVSPDPSSLSLSLAFSHLTEVSGALEEVLRVCSVGLVGCRFGVSALSISLSLESSASACAA